MLPKLMLNQKKRRWCQAPVATPSRLQVRVNKEPWLSSEPTAGFVHRFQLCLGKRQVQVEACRSWKAAIGLADRSYCKAPRLKLHRSTFARRRRFQTKTCSSWRWEARATPSLSRLVYAQVRSFASLTRLAIDSKSRTHLCYRC